MAPGSDRRTMPSFLQREPEQSWSPTSYDRMRMFNTIRVAAESMGLTYRGEDFIALTDHALATPARAKAALEIYTLVARLGKRL